MKQYSSAYANHLRQRVTTLAICCRIVRLDGVVVQSTTHDEDIPITRTNVGVELESPGIDLTGVYSMASGITASAVAAKSDMSVDNMEVNGALASADFLLGVSVADIQAGVFDGAAITIFRVNWQDPDDFQDVVRHGFMGEVKWNKEGAYSVEVRGLLQALQQNIGATASNVCDVEEIGDSRCKLNLAPFSCTGVVSSVANNRKFNATLTFPGVPPAVGHFILGKLVWTSGDNLNRVSHVKQDAAESTQGHIELYEEVPVDVQVGDTFSLGPGCSRQASRCKALSNIVNFRGAGLFTPGLDSIIRAPD